MSVIIKFPCYISLDEKPRLYKKIYLRNFVSSNICDQSEIGSSKVSYFQYPLATGYYAVFEQDCRNVYIPSMDYIEGIFDGPSSQANIIDEKRLNEIVQEDSENDDFYISELKRLGITQDDINRIGCNRIEPLTTEAKNFLTAVCGSGEIAFIRKCLERFLPNESIICFSWQQILWAFNHIAIKYNLLHEQKFEISKIIEGLPNSAKDRCPSFSAYIDKILNKMKKGKGRLDQNQQVANKQQNNESENAEKKMATSRPISIEEQAEAVQGNKSIEESEVTDQKAIWVDISPDMKVAIQDFWKESKAKKLKGNRLLIKKYCQKKGLDESTFRSEKVRVEKRKGRLKKPKR
jgi:hypothetical protein